MQYRVPQLKMFLVAILIATAAIGAWPYGIPVSLADGSPSGHKKAVSGSSFLSAAPEMGNFVFEEADGVVGCRQATPEEALAMTERSPNQGLHFITPIRPNVTGLTIMLRGTSQLESFPDAKTAFLRAAATWQNLIQTPITIIIDVDYGPTRFGQPYPPRVIGSTGTQTIGANNIYSDIRAALVEKASSDQELTLYKALPNSPVPTDIGTSATIFAPSSLFRALGLINPVANPDAEKNLGSPPSIGFNSNVGFPFDFDPSNGIDPGKIDFDATATHEIGHALGFISLTGDKELSPSDPTALSIWDLFRFRPGTTMSSFSNAQRILSSGGSQDFFVDSPELPLSTGRPDASGGDGEQASHWKASKFIGQRIGIMDPELAPGERATITPNDMLAIDSFGYQLAGQDSAPPIVTVTAPKGGESIMGTSQFTITWTSSDNVGVTRHDIALSTDGGATFPLSIASGLAGNAQSFVWSVPAIETTQGRIRVTAFDAANNSGFDTSAANFSITEPSPDFALVFDPAQVTVSRGQKGQFIVLINRTRDFAGNVTVTAPNTTPLKIKLAQTSQSTTGTSVSFDFKVKKKAPVGTQQLTFTGQDDSGRVRTGTLTLVIQ